MSVEPDQQPARQPDQIRARVEALLAGLPEDTELAGLSAPDDGGGPWEQLIRRLEEAHDVLVRALESVEKG